MLKLLLTIALLNLLAAMTPGPDVAIVTRNTLQYSRKTGILTALGIATAILVHITYCSLGLAIIIIHTPIIFNGIKIAGGAYLIYLGVSALKSNNSDSGSSGFIPNNLKKINTGLSNWRAFSQGFLTNILNPKAALFFLALFTMVVDARLSWFNLAIALTLFCVDFSWFCCLTLILSHSKVEKLLTRAQKTIIATMGIFLIAFGIALFFAHAPS